MDEDITLLYECIVDKTKSINLTDVTGIIDMKQVKYSLMLSKLACTIRGEVEALTIDEEIDHAILKLDNVIMMIEGDIYRLMIDRLNKEAIEKKRLKDLKSDTMLTDSILLSSKNNNIYFMLNLYKTHSNNVSFTTVKKAYKVMVVKIHPDKNKSPDASKAFIKLKTEYDKYKNNPNSYERTIQNILRPVVYNAYSPPKNTRTNAYGEKYKKRWSDYGCDYESDSSDSDDDYRANGRKKTYTAANDNW
jgi:hypothetical protein